MVSPWSLARPVIAILGELELLLQPGLFSGSFTRPASHASAHDAVLALVVAPFRRMQSSTGGLTRLASL
jgi:hypothetical protein